MKSNLLYILMFLMGANTSLLATEQWDLSPEQENSSRLLEKVKKKSNELTGEEKLDFLFSQLGKADSRRYDPVYFYNELITQHIHPCLSSFQEMSPKKANEFIGATLLYSMGWGARMLRASDSRGIEQTLWLLHILAIDNENERLEPLLRGMWQPDLRLLALPLIVRYAQDDDLAAINKFLQKNKRIDQIAHVNLLIARKLIYERAAYSKNSKDDKINYVRKRITSIVSDSTPDFVYSAVTVSAIAELIYLLQNDPAVSDTEKAKFMQSLKDESRILGNSPKLKQIVKEPGYEDEEGQTWGAMLKKYLRLPQRASGEFTNRGMAPGTWPNNI